MCQAYQPLEPCPWWSLASKRITQSLHSYLMAAVYSCVQILCPDTYTFLCNSGKLLSTLPSVTMCKFTHVHYHSQLLHYIFFYYYFSLRKGSCFLGWPVLNSEFSLRLLKKVLELQACSITSGITGMCYHIWLR